MNQQRKALLLLEQLIELPADQHSSFLDNACHDDAQLRIEVEALLAALDEPGSLLPDDPPALIPEATNATAIAGEPTNREPRFQSGIVLANRYQILSHLGTGGMGEVYRAEDSRLDRHVAIKTLNMTSLGDTSMHERFDRELRLIAALSHPNIVTLHDVAKHDDIHFAVMEFVDGQTLRHLSTEGIDWSTAVAFAQDIAAGLSSAHSQNLMHRDIKPENIIVSQDGRAKILDFGLARPETPDFHQDLTGAGGIVSGTAPFMSPEQAESRALTCATDIFSFGTVLLEMVTGVNPFRATTAFQTMRNVADAELQKSVDFPSDVPRELSSLVLAMLNKDASLRPSAADVVYQLSEIRKLLEGADISGKPESSLNPWKVAVPNNLPQRRMDLTGRVEERDKLSDLLLQNSLVTIVGPGGVGKTALAVEAGRNHSTTFPGGVWICEFASLRDESLVEEVLAAALDGNAGTISDLDHVIARLRDQSTLLLFDNCEHVIDSVAKLVDTLLERIEGLKILATSREALRTSGEYVYLLEGLPFRGIDSHAAELFVYRATSLSHYHDAIEHRRLVEQIVTKLDGLPLAVELAAAQLSVMSLEELVEALDDQMETLQSGKRSHDRQATVSKTIAWSFDLLSTAEQRTLQELSVFAGPFTNEAALRVCNLKTGGRRRLHRLVEQSMLARSEHQGRSRFRLLEPIRQFCQSQCPPELLEDARQRHAYYHAERVVELGRGIYGENEIACFVALNSEWPDLRKAIAWGREHRVAAVAIDPIVALTRAAMFHLRVELFQWMHAAIDVFGSEATDRADVNYVLGTGMWVKGNHDQARVYLDRCDQLATYVPNFYMQYAQLFHLQRFADSLQIIQRGRDVAKAQDDKLEARWLSMPFAAKTLVMADPTDSRIDNSMRTEGQTIMDLDWPTGHAFLTLVQGTTAMKRGDLPTAMQSMKESIAISNSCGNRALAALVGLFVDGLTDASTAPKERLESTIKNLQVMIDTGIESRGKVSAYPIALRSLILALVECNQLEAAVRFSGMLSSLPGFGDQNELSPEFTSTMENVQLELGDRVFERLQKAGNRLTIAALVEEAVQLASSLGPSPDRS